MKSAIRNALLVASGAIVSVPLSVMGVAAADSGHSQDPPVQHVIHSWDGVMPNFNLQVVGTEKQGQGTVVRNFVNNSNTTTVQQLSSNTNTNSNTAAAEGGSATGGAAQSQLFGDQAQNTAPVVIVPAPAPIAPLAVQPADDAPAPATDPAGVAPATDPAPAADAATDVSADSTEAPAPTGETSGVTDEG